MAAETARKEALQKAEQIEALAEKQSFEVKYYRWICNKLKFDGIFLDLEQAFKII